MSSTDVLVDIEGEKPNSAQAEENQSVNKQPNNTILGATNSIENIAVHTDASGVAQNDWKGKFWKNMLYVWKLWKPGKPDKPG